ncbi:MAG: pilin [Patescibacteria group bacterium]
MLDQCFKPIANGDKVGLLTCIPYLFENVVTAAFLFAGIIALIFIILSGIKFLMSGGDPKQLEGAKNTLTYAVLGFILILLSFAILNFISGITGVPCIKEFGFGNC